MNAEGSNRNGMLNEPTKGLKGERNKLCKKRTYKCIT